MNYLGQMAVALGFVMVANNDDQQTVTCLALKLAIEFNEDAVLCAAVSYGTPRRYRNWFYTAQLIIIIIIIDG